MNTTTQVRDSWIRQLSVRLVLLSLLFAIAGCAPAAPQTIDQVTPTLIIEATQTPIIEVTLPSGWETHASQEQCGYSISHPGEMDTNSMVTNSWTINFTSTEPSGPDTNFVYVSVIPDDFQGGPGEIYNYDPAATENLFKLQVGETGPLYDIPAVASWHVYTRLPDATLSKRIAQSYENNQPLDFPAGTKEIRYYLQANGCTYMIGGYIATLDSGEPRTMSQELFDAIIATFELSQ
jgi:hypothetical protein